jgi:hypothetical protein
MQIMGILNFLQSYVVFGIGKWSCIDFGLEPRALAADLKGFPLQSHIGKKT